MADKRLRTMVFPGLEDTYTIPQDMNDLESIEAVAEPYDEFASYSIGDYCSNGGKFYRCNTAILSGETWNANHWTETNVGDEILAEKATRNTALSGKVSKAGDTMTGDLTISGASSAVKDTRITSGTAPSSDIYGRSFYLFDSNGFNIGTLQVVSLANGREGFQLVAGKKVNGVNKYNYIRLYVDANGDPIVDLSSPAAWRAALSLNAINNTGAVGAGGLRIDFLNGSDQYHMAFYASGNNKVTLFDKNWNSVWHIPWDYKANDTFSITSSLVLNGFIGNSAKTMLYFDCVVDRSMENISTISVTAMTGYIVGTNGRDTSGNTDYTGSGFTLSCTKQGNHHVRIGITKTSAFPIGDGFTPATYFGTLTLKFT